MIRHVMSNHFCKTKACDMFKTLQLLPPIAIRGNMLRQIGCILFVSICLPLLLNARSPFLTVSGKVTDSKNNPLPGVSVVLKGTNKGTTTSSDGTFQFADVPENGVLVFSYTGYGSQEISLKGK